MGPFGSPVLAGAGKTDPPSLLILSQTSAGSPGTSAWLRLVLNDQAGRVAASTTLAASKLRPWARTPHAMRASLLASAIASTLRCSRLLAASIQGFEPIALPVLRPDQDNPGGLNEEGAQVAIAALRYLAKDRSVSGRELFGDKTQPGGEVAALGERI